MLRSKLIMGGFGGPILSGIWKSWSWMVLINEWGVDGKIVRVAIKEDKSSAKSFHDEVAPRGSKVFFFSQVAASKGILNRRSSKGNSGHWWQMFYMLRQGRICDHILIQHLKERFVGQLVLLWVVLVLHIWVQAMLLSWHTQMERGERTHGMFPQFVLICKERNRSLWKCWAFILRVEVLFSM